MLAFALVCAVTFGARADDAADADAKLVAQLREASALRDKGDYGGAAKKLAKLEDASSARRSAPARGCCARTASRRRRTWRRRPRPIPAAELRAHLYAELASIYLERNDLASAHQAQRRSTPRATPTTRPG